MCCEDLKISESIWGEGHTIAIVAGDQEILPADPHRVSIIFGQPDAGTVRLTAGNDDAAGAGLLLGPALPPVLIDKWRHGQLVTKSWRGFAAGATSLYVLESLLSPQNPCNKG